MMNYIIMVYHDKQIKAYGNELKKPEEAEAALQYFKKMNPKIPAMIIGYDHKKKRMFMILYGGMMYATK